ncbi:MAG: ABC transporter permease [Bryobacterales bacterium]|nr:ABC transporter permease [Bryobacterales bacterium]
MPNPWRNAANLFWQLVLKDFRVRYRNMSLGMFWSLLNPLVMMALLTFVFTRIYRAAEIPNFPVFVLCGIVPFNFFTLSWLTATTSIVDNARLIKRVAIPRVLIPFSTVAGNVLHLFIQFGLLLVFVFAFGYRPNVHWFWLPGIWLMTILFACGVSLVTSALNIYLRDVKYVVESANLVLFWLVPIFYPFSSIPAEYRDVYQFNPVAALVLAMRQILMYDTSPATSLLWKLALVSVASLVGGVLVFRILERRFYEYL